jgi:tetratricopeptide (TPR) repeat protein
MSLEAKGLNEPCQFLESIGEKIHGQSPAMADRAMVRNGGAAVQTAKAAMLLCLTVATGLGCWYLTDNQWRRPDEDGQTFLKQERFVEAERLFATAVEAARSFGSHDPRLARSLFHQAQSLAAQGKYTEAIPLLKESAAIKERILGPNHHDVVLVLKHYAAALRKTGQVDEAIAVETRAGRIEHKFD